MRPKTMRRKRRGLLQTRPACPVGAHRGHAQHQARPGQAGNGLPSPCPGKHVCSQPFTGEPLLRPPPSEPLEASGSGVRPPHGEKPH